MGMYVASSRLLAIHDNNGKYQNTHNSHAHYTHLDIHNVPFLRHIVKLQKLLPLEATIASCVLRSYTKMANQHKWTVFDTCYCISFYQLAQNAMQSRRVKYRCISYYQVAQNAMQSRRVKYRCISYYQSAEIECTRCAPMPSIDAVCFCFTNQSV